MVTLVVTDGDIRNRPCDLLILKYADGFYGVDQIVSERIGFKGDLTRGAHLFLPGKNIEARKVLYINVGPLTEFRYPEIRDFGHKALALAAQGRGTTKTICSPIHGPGYGLDEVEAFLSLMGGFLDAIEDGNYPRELEKIEIVEANEYRASRLASVLAETFPHKNIRFHPSKGSVTEREFKDTEFLHKQLASYGVGSENKPKVFVAMPFKDEYHDEWNIAIQEAAEAVGILCERIDTQVYVGDIVTQIKKRIAIYDGLLALLNESNPNVFLEIGFAWASDKPTVLMLKKGNNLPFDVQGQRCLIYTSISDLRDKLKNELKGLKEQGIFSPRLRSN